MLKDYGPFITFLLQLLWFALAWWVRRNLASRDDMQALTTRVSQLELASEGAPSLADIAELRIEMEKHTGEMRTFAAELAGVRQTWDARVQGIEQTMKRVESQTNMLTRHLLNAES